MTGAYILALDQGTTSSRAILVDGRGQIRGTGQRAFAQHYPRPGWVEHDPEEIWRSTLEAIGDALAAAEAGPRDIAGVGITNQRETLVTWDRASGQPLAPAIVWQDRRTAAICDELREQGHEPHVQSATGLILDPYFTGTKITWLLREHPGLRGRAETGDIAVGTVDSWLVWKLTGRGRHVTDYTNASRTLLFDIDRALWDDELLGMFGVPRKALPEVLPSRGVFGHTSAGAAGFEAPIVAVAGDQQSALVGQAGFAEGEAKNTYGTGCFLLANAGGKSVRSANRLLTSLAATSTGDSLEYVVEGSVFVAGSLVQWLRDGLGMLEASGDVEALASSVPDAGGVTIVPAFTGLGAPYWDPHARGAILGITRGAERGHIARAALEAIALSSAELAHAMAADLGEPIRELRVDGGAARNNLLMQLQADYLGCRVVRPRNTETTAMGAAYLAGLEVGTWAGVEEIESLWEVDRVFEPEIGDDERQMKLDHWQRAVERTLRWAAEA